MIHADFLLASCIRKKCVPIVIIPHMGKFEMFLYTMYDYIRYVVCLKMVTNKSVKWKDTLCDVEYTHSNQEYDRKSVPSSTTPDPVSNFADIFGNQV